MVSIILKKKKAPDKPVKHKKDKKGVDNDGELDVYEVH
jgi:hypothetical protein